MKDIFDKLVKDIYAIFGNYCATLWDVINAASRLQDYIDIGNEVTTMHYENNSINIGNNNQITSSVIGTENSAKIEQKNPALKKQKESFASKGFWKILVPIFVIVVGAAICSWLGLK